MSGASRVDEISLGRGVHHVLQLPLQGGTQIVTEYSYARELPALESHGVLLPAVPWIPFCG